ncbi:molybdopterin-guanine dinucleotide biosynthesis protein B [Pelolinea submarina]|uniref:Molybdopterin-guanine dinucleotide biosynthesis protein B n=1 Tax=Pelolinea submarina TaxID=913107 RepID=A0A347ZSL6_9CHLR|nr:molybdopterin-guanine dinucleotide biosynthesis protein B [Pelolinea submarina]REG11134.1 molybdopterin-guanine dinucleotide biosynthesis protein B [Pelolinea submarina]BBB48297.1 molybdopterin-guanine dinucleotide biosynthesis protein B [Pelolinea submarina]
MPETPEKDTQAAVIGFYGYSDSGKTTLIERLIGDLRAEELRVAAVKLSEQALSLDQPGKDSDRYAQAGANGVALAGQGETGFRFPERLDLRTILRVLAEVSAPDVILVEGAEEDFVPKVRLGDKALRANTIWTYDGDYDRLMKIIHDIIKKE